MRHKLSKETNLTTLERNITLSLHNITLESEEMGGPGSGRTRSSKCYTQYTDRKTPKKPGRPSNMEKAKVSTITPDRSRDAGNTQFKEHQSTLMETETSTQDITVFGYDNTKQDVEQRNKDSSQGSLSEEDQESGSDDDASRSSSDSNMQEEAEKGMDLDGGMERSNDNTTVDEPTNQHARNATSQNRRDKKKFGTIYDYLNPPLVSKDQTKPPLPRQVNRPERVINELPERTYKLHIKMRKHLQKSGQVINIVDHFKILLSRMIIEIPNLILVPFDDNSKENHIIQGCDVPAEEDKFTQYVKGARITKADSLLLNFKVISPLPFGGMKNKPSLFKFLQDKKYYLQLQQLTTYDNIKVGGFIYIDNQYVRRDDMTMEIQERINGGYMDTMEI